MALNYTFYPTLNYTGVTVYPAYNDNTHIVTSDTLNRQNFNVLSDVYINDDYSGTLKNYPFENHIEINPSKLIQSFISPDFLFDTVRAQNCENSIKKLYLISKETYKREISFSSTTNNIGLLQLNLTSSHNLRANDRIYVIKDDASINPQYNTYMDIISTTSNSILTDFPYYSATTVESGKIWEGIQFFDYGYTGNQYNIYTANNHNFQEGDTIFLQMDTWATGIIKLVSGNTGSITSVQVNGVNIITNPVPYNTSLAKTAEDLASEISTTVSNPQYSAYNYSGDARCHIYSKRWSGTTVNGYPITATTSGNLGIVFSPSMFIQQGVDSVTNTGWNPQFTGTYKIDKITSPKTFTLNTVLPGPINFNPPGSERGSIFSQNNYISDTGYTGTSYFVLNNANKYDYKDYKSEIQKYTTKNSNSKFLSNRENNINFFSNYEYYTADILFSTSASTAPIRNIILNLLDNSGNTTTYGINVYDIYTATTINSDFYKFTFGIGPKNLNDVNTAYITPTPTGTLINDNIVSYQVYLTSGATNDLLMQPTTQTLKFSRKCSKYNTVQIMFLNRWGSYDYFTLNSIQYQSNYERSEFERKPERFYSNTEYGVKNGNKGFGIINNFEQENFILSTNWLTENETNVLKDLFSSTDIYLYFPSSDGAVYNVNFFPVIMTDTEVSFFNDRNGLKKYEFNFRKGLTKINQINQ